MIAGDMPVPAVRQEGQAAKRMEIAVAEAVQQLQHAVADVREAWWKAGEQEVARRREERAGRALRKGVIWKWISTHAEVGRARRRIWEAWKRHRARTDWQERVESRREGRQRAAT